MAAVLQIAGVLFVGGSFRRLHVLLVGIGFMDVIKAGLGQFLLWNLGESVIGVLVGFDEHGERIEEATVIKVGKENCLKMRSARKAVQM